MAAAAARDAGREPGLLRRLQGTELSSSPRSLTHSTAVLLLLLALPPGEQRLCAGGRKGAVPSPGSPGPRHGCKDGSGSLIPPPPAGRAEDTMTNLRREEEEAKEEGAERQRRPRLGHERYLPARRHGRGPTPARAPSPGRRHRGQRRSWLEAAVPGEDRLPTRRCRSPSPKCQSCLSCSS